MTLQCDRLSVLLIMGVSLVMNGQSLNHRTGNRLCRFYFVGKLALDGLLIRVEMNFFR